MAEWDLTPVLAKYLDSHFVYGLLEFLDNKKIYDEDEIFKYKVQVLEHTNLIDYSIFAYEAHGDPIPDFIIQKKQDLLEEKERLISELGEVIESIGLNLDEQEPLTTSLQSKVSFSPEKIDLLYQYARFAYNNASYKESSVFLNWYQVFITQTDKNYLNVLWGYLACSILSQQWKQAQDYFNSLKSYIDSSNFTPIQALQQRTWLIHWGLFIFFNIEHGRDFLVELFFDSKNFNNKQSQNNPYLIAIQTSCPHILRYLTAAVITHKSRRLYMKELVRLIQQESYNYRDPITEFVECLYVNFDFDGAQKKLRDCEVVLHIDFFLTACIDDFIENARLFIFEIFCQIHECISINMIADKLNMSIDDAERWIAKLIRDAHFDAKIDSKNGHVIMGTQAVLQYHQLIEKTKAMRLRTEMLAVNIEKTLHKKSDRSMWN